MNLLLARMLTKINLLFPSCIIRFTAYMQRSEVQFALPIGKHNSCDNSEIGYFVSWLKTLLGLPWQNILSLTLFNIILNGLFWLNEKTDIYIFVDDSILYSCVQFINEVIKNLRYNVKIVLNLFMYNQKMTKNGKF